MSLDDGAANRESYTNTLGLGCEEWIKDAACLFGINSFSRIMHLDQRTIRVLCRLDA
jgi:hypothetical protein